MPVLNSASFTETGIGIVQDHDFAESFMCIRNFVSFTGLENWEQPAKVDYAFRQVGLFPDSVEKARE